MARDSASLILFPTHDRQGRPLEPGAGERPRLMACVDEPAVTDVEVHRTCRFSGWALSASGRNVVVRASFQGNRKDYPAQRVRQDVLAVWRSQYPEASERCGFQFFVDTGAIPDPVAVSLEFDDGECIARSPEFRLRSVQREAALRSDYKNVWNSVSKVSEDAKFAVAGHSNEEQFRRAAEATVATLEWTVGIHSDDTVLEIGAGVGRVGACLAKRCRKWIGADVSENMLAHLRDRLAEHPNVETVVLNGWDLSPIPSESVDVVYCTVVFMHLDEWERFSYVAEGARVLRPGGRMYVDNVNLLSEGGWAFFISHLENFHPLDRPPNISKTSTPEELRTYFERAGYADIRQWSESLWIATFGTKPLKAMP